MKAITLHQPWASLIADGVKRIETRSWATSYRGLLAIHAGKRWPDRHHYFPPLCPSGCWRDEMNCPGHISVLPTITDPAHQRPHRTDIRDRVPRASQTPTIFWPKRGAHARAAGENGYGQTSYAPLGAMVATCMLIDCVPIMHIEDAFTLSEKHEPCIGVDPNYVTLYDKDARGVAVTDQRPFGDFSPGRWAWLLGDVVRLDEPVPAKGRQGLWEWAA